MREIIEITSVEDLKRIEKLVRLSAQKDVFMYLKEKGISIDVFENVEEILACDDFEIEIDSKSLEVVVECYLSGVRQKARFELFDQMKKQGMSKNEILKYFDFNLLWAGILFDLLKYVETY